MVQTPSQKAQQNKQVQIPTNLKELNRTSLRSPQQVPLCESNVEPLLQELYPKELEIKSIQDPFEEKDTENPNIPQETHTEYDYALIEARKRLTQLRIPQASPHVHSLSPCGTHYDLDELPLESPVQILKELKLPSSIHTTNPILQKGVFKLKYVKVKKFLLDGSFVLSYVRRLDYTPSTLSRYMQEMYDRVSLHTASSISQNLEGFTSFCNPYQLSQFEKNPYKNIISSTMQRDSQIMPFIGILELPESSYKPQILQPIPPYIHMKEETLPQLTQERLR